MGQGAMEAKVMSYCVTHLIAIQPVSGLKRDDYLRIIAKTAREIDDCIPLQLHSKRGVAQSLSKELFATKGGWIILGGTFNHWHYTLSEEFVGRLSEVLDTNIKHFCKEEDYSAVYKWWYRGKLQDGDYQHPSMY